MLRGHHLWCAWLVCGDLLLTLRGGVLVQQVNHQLRRTLRARLALLKADPNGDFDVDNVRCRLVAAWGGGLGVGVVWGNGSPLCLVVVRVTAEREPGPELRRDRACRHQCGAPGGAPVQVSTSNCVHGCGAVVVVATWCWGVHLASSAPYDLTVRIC